MKTYIIKSITDRSGKERKDGRYPLRTGRRCTVEAILGMPMYAYYKPLEGDTSYRGTLVTSPVDMIQEVSNGMIVTTQNSAYYLEEDNK